MNQRQKLSASVAAMVFVVFSATMVSICRTVMNEEKVVSQLRTLSACQAYFEEKQSRENGRSRYASLNELLAANLIADDALDSSTHSFEFHSSEKTWWVKASPINQGRDGYLYYFVNQSHVIYHLDRDFKVDQETGKPDRKLMALGAF